MRKGKTIPFRGIGAIVASVTIPAVIIYFAMNNGQFENFTKKAGLTCAKLMFWDVDKTSQEKSTENNEVINELVNKSENVVSDGSIWAIDMAQEEKEIKIPDSEVKAPDVTKPINNSLPYPENQDNRSGVIKQMSFTKYSGAQYIDLSAGQVRNCTTVSNDALVAESKKKPEFKIELNGEPQVLIMHTHTTESYEPCTRDFYDSSFTSRTTDRTKSVIAVGEKIKQELEAVGIVTIHDETLHDYPSYNGSYQRSAVTVQKILKDNPSIKVVLDVHRDAIQSSDGLRSSPVATVNGKQAAQIMIISGCDDGTMNMPEYMQNFRLASLMQTHIEGENKGITRPVLFDYRKYNQDLTTGSLLLEMGSHGNSLDEALYSGELVGKSIANTLLECR